MSGNAGYTLRRRSGVGAVWLGTAGTDDACSRPSQNTLYNCSYLKADERGCNACHDDLGALLNSGSYGHTGLTNSLGIDIDVQVCVDCHTVGDGYQTTFYDFGTLIHGIHQDVSDATSK